MPTLGKRAVVFLGKTLNAFIPIGGVHSMDKNASWQPQGCRLSVRFLNWTMYRCVLKKDTSHLYSQNGSSKLPVVMVQLSLTKDCKSYEALSWSSYRLTIHVVSDPDAKHTTSVKYEEKDI